MKFAHDVKKLKMTQRGCCAVTNQDAFLVT